MKNENLNENFIRKMGQMSRGNDFTLVESDEACNTLKECMSKLNECNSLMESCVHESLTSCKMKLSECMSSVQETLSTLQGMTESFTSIDKDFTGSNSLSVFYNQLNGLSENLFLNCDLKNNNVLVISSSKDLDNKKNYSVVLKDKHNQRFYRNLDLSTNEDVIVYLKRHNYFIKDI